MGTCPAGARATMSGSSPRPTPPPSRREAFHAACPDGRWYDTVDDLLSGEPLDFVDICAPPGSHAALIGRALDAGLHVLSEKPLVTARRRRDAPGVGRRARRACPAHGSQLAQVADLPQDLGADRRRRDRRRPIGALADAADSAGDRRQRARRRQLARRSEARGRRNPVRPWLACALLRRPLDRRSPRRLGAARDAPLPRPAARGHRDSRPGDSLRLEPHLSDLGRRRAL